MELLRIYSDCLVSLFLFLTLDLFLTTFFTCCEKEKHVSIRVLFILLWGIISYIPYEIPYFTLVNLILNLLYVFLICKNNFRTRFIAFVKYEIYYVVGSTIISLLHTFITMDIYIYEANKIYARYTSIIGNFLLYVILSMYIILKKLSDFPSGKIYKRYFLGITGLSISLLVICSMILGSSIINQEGAVPLLFSMLLIVTLLCISIYRKVISVLEENAIVKIEVEKNALQQNYYAHVQESLQTISYLRHDFKNHLIVLQGHAAAGNTEELNNYLNRICEELTPTTLIATPSPLLSAILNAKNEECKRAGVTLTLEQNFTGIYFDDFHLVTIFSNLLDNAITAASKCKNGTIRLRLTTIQSYLDIDCVNDHKETIIKKNDRFMSTKPTQKEIHGLGILSMRKTVEQLNGEIEIDYTEDSFHVNILMPNYK